MRTFRVSRIRSDIRFATRRERDFRLPEDFDIEQYRGRPKWQFGDVVGEARIEVAADTAWWVERAYGGSATASRTASSSPSTPSLPLLAALDPPAGGPRGPARARRSCAGSSSSGLRRGASAHEGEPRADAADGARRAASTRCSSARRARSRPSASRVLQSLLAYLLAACGDETRGRDPGRASSSSASRSRAEPLEEHLSLLNLVNFGGGCYAVYAELHGDEVHVDKELFGDTFRRAPRLTPLEARAIRLALEFVGPMIAAGRALAARARAREARGDLRRVRPRADARAAGRRRGGARRDAERGRSTSTGSSSSST